MLPGPIFSVELLTSARRTRYFAIRMLYAGLLLIVLVSTYQTNLWQRSALGNTGTIANFTAQFFETFTLLQILAVVLVGPALVAGTISAERERRTIEYLFVTTLSNREIVVGKLAARLVHIVYLLLAGVPVLALAMLMGGIAPESLALCSLSIASTMLTVATLSIAISVGTPREWSAVVRTYLVLFLLLAGPPIAFAATQGTAAAAWLGPILDQLLAPNPFWAYGEISSASGPTGPINPWTVVALLVRNQLIVSAAALLLATLSVRRVHLRQSGVAQKRRWRFQLFRGAIGNRPMLWKEIFAEPASARLGLLGYGVLVIATLALIGSTIYAFRETISHPYHGQFGEEYLGYAMSLGTLVSCGGLLLLASRAAGSITSEKERQCWDSLLGTPLEPREIISAKILGSLWAVRGVLLMLTIVWLPAVILMPSFLVAVAFLLGTLLIVALFIASLGVWMSLRSKSSTRAMSMTLGTCIFLGGGYLFCGSMCCMPLAMAGPGPGRGVGELMELAMGPCIPFLLAFPGIVAMTGRTEAGPQGEMIFAYILGTGGYLAAAAFLFYATLGGFDRLTGRTRAEGQTRRRPQETALIAQVVGPPGGPDSSAIGVPQAQEAAARSNESTR